MKKELNYYIGLPYKIEIVPIAADEGGGFMARLPQFGILGIVGDGETLEEALADLFENQKDRFECYLEQGLPIPEPEQDTEEFSGRLVLRMPKFLHRELATSAKENGSSLNQYLCTLLAMNMQSNRFSMTVADFQQDLKSLNQCIGDLTYHKPRMPRISGIDLKTASADVYERAA